MDRMNAQQIADIEAARDHAAVTLRPTVPAIEALLQRPFPVLDHGFVRVVDYMGDDGAIVQAARVSYGRGTRRVSEDEALIRYLMRHRHSTPFEMCEIKFHVKLPIFVARQWIRHRMASVNEYSARYSVLDREFYLPAPEQLAKQSTGNRQGRDVPLAPEEAERVLDLLRDDATRCYDHYLALLNQDERGETIDENRPHLARELARITLTLSSYTQWYWKTDLHNLLNFLALRGDPHAQYEIRAYAEPMLDMVRAWVPLAASAFEEYRLGAFTLSASMRATLKRMLSGQAVDQASSGLSKREWAELEAAIM